MYVLFVYLYMYVYACVCVFLHVRMCVCACMCVCMGATPVPKGYNQIYSGVQVLTIHQLGATESLHGFHAVDQDNLINSAYLQLFVISFRSVNECFYSVCTEQSPFQQFLRTEFIAAVSIFFCAEKDLKLESPDPLMRNKVTHRRQPVCQVCLRPRIRHGLVVIPEKILKDCRRVKIFFI